MCKKICLHLATISGCNLKIFPLHAILNCHKNCDDLITSFQVLETEDSNDALGLGISESDETEQNAINDDLYDDDVIEPIMNESDSNRAKTAEPSSNLFGSARDVVINIVKKAAEALVNVPQQNRSHTVVNHSTNVSGIYEPETTAPACVTLKYAISCVNCEQPFFDRYI